MKTSEEILCQITKAYLATTCDYRDKIIICGQMLNQFITTRLLECEDKSKRYKTRSKAVNDIIAKLKTSKTVISRYIKAAMVIGLLSDNGQLGALGIRAIDQLSAALIERDVKSETWVIKKQCKAFAVDCFREAVLSGTPFLLVPDLLKKYGLLSKKNVAIQQG
jgi:hypothetical protein